MKKCPKCQSIVETEYECKICGTSIVYEPFVDADREQIAKGYRLRYWLPKLKLPIAATVMFIIAMIVHRAIDIYVWITAGIVILSWLFSFFKLPFVSLLISQSVSPTLWKYNEDDKKFEPPVDAAVLSGIAIIMSIILMFL